MVLPVVLLRSLAFYTIDLSRLHIQLIWFPFGISVALIQVADLLIAAFIALLLLRRLLQSVKRQKEMALDVKQAQEVQQVILPENRIELAGLRIESEYRPAREVGGDFFQIIHHPADDSLLIVAGDVAGKGLKAGMLVALLVGAIRTASETNPEPAAILGALNRRLLGRGDARATCLALRIERDGSAVLANSGHLPPYLNGAPLEIEGSLPLGLVEQFDCSTLEFNMSPGDQLLMMSDGVAEAAGAEGELFGFDRVLELVRTQPAAKRIADIAQAYGQEDDISVISVTRLGVAEPALV
jgi:serine phosphatase RsbU (regulator of sigma subunit)